MMSCGEFLISCFLTEEEFRLSPSVITFCPISEFSYKLVRVLLHTSIVRSDNEIMKFSFYNMECSRQTRPLPWQAPYKEARAKEWELEKETKVNSEFLFKTYFGILHEFIFTNIAL